MRVALVEVGLEVNSRRMIALPRCRKSSRCRRPGPATEPPRRSGLGNGTFWVLTIGER